MSIYTSMTQPTPVRAPRAKKILPYHEKKWFSESKIFGGKTYLARPIFRHAPKSFAVYADLYGGEGSMTYNAPGGPIAYYNDLNFFRYITKYVIKTNVEALITALEKRQYNEDTFLLAKTQIEIMTLAVENKNPCTEEPDWWLEAATAWIVTRRMSRLGLGNDFGWSDRVRGGNPGDVNAWINMIRDMRAKNQRLQGVNLLNTTAIEAMGWVQTQHVGWPIFFYLDPTYPKPTRKGGKEYGKFEMTLEQHKELCIAVQALPTNCHVALSSYSNQWYDEWLSGWRKIEIKTKCRAGQGRTLNDRTEVLYVNY